MTRTERARLDARVAIVTGGASGIGAATAAELARRGARVVVLDREPAGPPETISRRVDLGDVGSLPGVVDEIARELGRLDIVVNCAGVVARKPALADVTAEEFDRVFRVNVLAPMLLVKEAAPHLCRRGGSIVNVTSSSAFRADAPAIYSSSKAALGQFTRSVAAELGPFGVNVNNVAPGMTDTPLSRGARSVEGMREAVVSGPLANLLHRVSEPEDVAEAIVFLCVPASRQITGQTIHTSAGAVV